MTVPTQPVKHAGLGKVSKAERLGLASVIAEETDGRNDAQQLADKFEAALAHFGLTVHPKAMETPQFTMAEFISLRDKIKANGLLQAVLITDEQELLDGRHRLMACYDLGITPDFRVVSGEQPVQQAAIYDSESRRHQTKSQITAWTVLFHEDKIRELTKAGVERRKAGKPHYGDHNEVSPGVFVSQTAAVGIDMANQAVSLLNAGRIDLLVDVRDGKIVRKADGEETKLSMERAYQQHLKEQKGAEDTPEEYQQLVEYLTKLGNAATALGVNAKEIQTRLAFVDDDGSIEALCLMATKVADALAKRHSEIIGRLAYTVEEDADGNE